MLATLVASLLLAPATLSLTVGGVTRTAVVYAPTGDGPFPVVIGFHGHGGSGRNVSRTWGLQEAWPQALVIFADGLPTSTRLDPQGTRPGWDVTTSASNKDVLFFDALRDAAISKYRGDSHRLFVMGHSNGGGFVYVLWALRGSEIAGFGSFEGAGGDKSKLTPPRPLFMTIGANDRVVRPGGLENELKQILSVNGSSGVAEPSASGYSSYPGKAITVVCRYDGGHNFHKAAIPELVKFFQSATPTR